MAPTKPDTKPATEPAADLLTPAEYAILNGLRFGRIHHVAATEMPYVDAMRGRNLIRFHNSGHLQMEITDAGLAAWRDEDARRTAAAEAAAAEAAQPAKT